jgi:hypothetical protein
MLRDNRRLNDLLAEARLLAGCPTVRDVLRMTPDAIWRLLYRPGLELPEPVQEACIRGLSDEQLIFLVRQEEEEA